LMKPLITSVVRGFVVFQTLRSPTRNWKLFSRRGAKQRRRRGLCASRRNERRRGLCASRTANCELPSHGDADSRSVLPVQRRSGSPRGWVMDLGTALARRCSHAFWS